MNKKFDYIDAIRGIAILMVIMVHVLQDAVKIESKNIAFIIESVGGKGVQLFFVASAFTLFISANNRKNSEANPTLNFFVRRVFRIAPMYYLGVFYYLWQNGLQGQQYWLGNTGTISSGNIIANFFFLHGFNPFWINSLVPGGWSITVEMMFYLMVPILAIKINNLNKAVTFLVGSFVFGFVVNKLLMQLAPIDVAYLWNDYLNIYFINQLPVFACGIVAYFIISGENNKMSRWNLISFAVIPLIVIFSGEARNLYVVIGILFSASLIFLSRYKLKVFVNSFFIYLGKISFSAYLVHFAVIHFLNYFELITLLPKGNFLFSVFSYIICLIAVLGITSLLSSMFYKFIEQPAQIVGKNLIKRIEDKSVINRGLSVKVIA